MAKSKEVTRHKLSKGRYLVKIGETWYLETCKAGRQRRRTLGTSDINQAMELQKALPTADDELPAPEPKKPAAPPVALSFSKALEEYGVWYTENNRESGWKRLKPVLDLFVAAMGPERDPKTITRDDVQKWVRGRRDGRSPMTVRNDFARIRALIYWIADRKDAAERKVCRGIDLPKLPRHAKAAPSPEKVRAVLKKLGDARPCDAWIGDYCRVLAETGMRPSELLGVRGTDLRGKLLSIEPHDARDLKNNYSKRVIELNATAADILKARVEKMFEKKRPIFPNELGEVFKANSAYHVFRDTLSGKKHGEVPEELDMTLYDFRHFFCSEHAAAGHQHMNMETLGAYIGHSPASTQTLARWYVDQKALLRGAPVPLVGESKEGRIIDMKEAE